MRTHNKGTIKILRKLSAVLYLISLLFSFPVSAQIKIYVNTDLEGISGVYQFAQTREKNYSAEYSGM